MYASASRFNIIKIITLAVFFAFIAFALLAGEFHPLGNFSDSRGIKKTANGNKYGYVHPLPATYQNQIRMHNHIGSNRCL